MEMVCSRACGYWLKFSMTMVRVVLSDSCLRENDVK